MPGGLGGLLPPVVASLVADIGEFKAKMGEARVEMDETEGTAARTGVLGKAGLMALAGGAIAVGAETIHMASEFDAAMTRINTQDNANLTTKQMKDLRTSVLNLAGPTAQAPDALAEAMIHVYGAGMKGAQAVDLLRVAAEGATVGHANLTDVTNALDAAVAVGIPGVQNYQQAMGELNATVGAGDMTMQNLADALGGPMLATVKSYGLSITDVGAGLAVFGDRNIRGSEAATELRMAVQALAVPAKEGGSALHAIGIASGELNQDLQQGGLKQALNDLNEHLLKAGYTSKNAGQLITEAFGKKAGGGLNVLMDSLSSSTSNFNQKFEDVARSGQNFGKDWAQTQDTLAFKIKSLESAAEALGIKIGNALIPYVTQLLGYLQDTGRVVGEVVDWFKQHKEASAALGAVLGGVLLYGVYTATIALWEMAAAVVAATWPFVAIAAAIGAVAYSVIYAYEHWAWFRTVVKDVGEVFSWLWGKVEEFASHFSSIWHAALAPYVLEWHIANAVVKDVWNDASKFLSDIWGSLTDLWNGTGGKVISAISDGWDEVSASVSQEWDKIYGDLSSIWGNLTELWNDTGGKLVTAVNNAMNGTHNAVYNTWTLISGYFRSTFEMIEGVVKAGWDIVRGIFQTTWDQIYGVVTTAWDLISGYVEGALDVIYGVVKASWDVFIGMVKIAWDLIKGDINTTLDIIKGLIQTFTDLVTGKWGKLWSDVKSTASSFWNDIKTMIGGILGTIFTTVVNAATNIWNGFISGIEDSTAGVWNAMIDIWNTIIKFFKDAGTWLLQAGKDLIQGLINGVESMGDAAVNAVKGLGNNIIGGAEHLLGIHSPSTVFHQIGAYVGQGLINGITGQAGATSSAAAGLAKAALAGFGTPTMTATGGVTWSGADLAAANMNGGAIPGAGGIAGDGLFGAAPNIQIYLDGSEITGAIRTKTLRYDMRNSGNGLALAGRGFQ